MLCERFEESGSRHENGTYRNYAGDTHLAGPHRSTGPRMVLQFYASAHVDDGQPLHGFEAEVRFITGKFETEKVLET